MNDVVLRLRASRIESETNESKFGRKSGVEWAKHDAEWPMLSRLARAVKDRCFEPGHGISPAKAVIMLAMSETEYRELVPRELSELVEVFFGATDESDVSLDFARAFVEGALEVYNQVADDVER